MSGKSDVPCVNIIGAGLAGLSCAFNLAKEGIASNLISPQASCRAQSVMAEGGINAAMKVTEENDSVSDHFADTIRGGAYIGEEDSVRDLTEAAPGIVNELISLGVPFNNEDGVISLRYFGGQKKRRTAYSQSSTGKLVMSAMIDAVRRFEACGLVRRYANHEFEELVTDDNGCAGVIIRDLYNLKAYELKGPVVVCSGGMNSLFPGRTTGTTVNTGDVTAYLYSAGVKLSNLEFIQFHPTTVNIPGKRCLVSEAARGEGGRLFVWDGNKKKYFMEEKYPELGNLMPRDITAREIDSRDGGFCYLDMTELPSFVWENKLSDMREELIRLIGTDPVTDYIKVSPGIHYFMGGIYVDRNHKTSMDHLYAAGECACRYHGANRLGGNSMLGALYGGQKAALRVSEDLKGEDTARQFPAQAVERDIPYEHTDFTAPSGVAEALFKGAGIIREASLMNEALRSLDSIDDKEFTRKNRNRLLLSKAILICANGRRESRGSHFRKDFPDKDDINFKGKSVIAYEGGRHDLSLIPSGPSGNNEGIL